MQISIGRFSKLTRLSVKALRLYDERGLLRAARVDASSGYRYYDTLQVGPAEVIRTLRSIDMPLEEIQAIVNSADDEKVREGLLAHRERLSERVESHRRMLGRLDSILRDKSRLAGYEVQVVEEKPCQVAAVRFQTTIDAIANSISSGFGTLVRGLSSAGISPSGSPALVFHDVIDEESDGEIEIVVPIGAPLVRGAEVYSRELEGGTMATTTHRGPYEAITPVYHVLARWIVENAYVVSGPPREIYLNDPRVTEPEELMTRVAFPILPESSEDFA